MTFALQFNSTRLTATADSFREIPAGYVLNGAYVKIHFPETPVNFYCHGWQSWSLTTWQDVNFKIPVLKPEIFTSRQTDMVYARYPNPNGSWLGALDFADGKVLFLGALGLDAHVAYREGALQGWYESGSGEWFAAYGDEQEIFAYYAALLGEQFGRAAERPTPRIWCSWYSYYTTITEKKLKAALESLGDLPFDIFQIDDGWQVGPGDWEPNAKFPAGMDRLAAQIKASGRKAGLWLAPLIIGKSSSIYRDHPDWLLHDLDGKLVFAGFEWGSEVFALDATHPEAAQWLANLIEKIVGWGFEYLKLDFLYAGALPGNRYRNLPRETAYRETMELIRQAAGDTYLLTCGTPILPVLGLCDAIRIGPDVANYWHSKLYSYYLYNQTTPSVQNGIRTTVNRLWLKPLVQVDPDVAFFVEGRDLSTSQRQLFLALTEICGFKASSDLPQAWTPAQRAEIRQWLESSPQVRAGEGRYRFRLNDRQVDFFPAMSLPPIPKGLDALLSLILGFLGNQLWALKLWNILFRNKVAGDE
jgi:alpha-galactosidase